MREAISLWYYNLWQRRICWPPPADYDTSPANNLRWRDIRFCSFGVWDTVIKAKLRGEHVPAGVIIVGAPLTRRDLERASEIVKELGLGKEDRA